MHLKVKRAILKIYSCIYIWSFGIVMYINWEYMITLPKLNEKKNHKTNLKCIELKENQI